jgi:hypothetical protein
MESKVRHSKISVSVLVAALISFLVSGEALSQTPFFQGKTVTIVQGRDPGGTGDMRVRAMMPFLQKHIPGNPTIVNEYTTNMCRVVEAAKPPIMSSSRCALMD